MILTAFSLTHTHTHQHVQYGSATKFPGSGGAVIGLCLDESKKVLSCLISYQNYIVFLIILHSMR